MVTGVIVVGVIAAIVLAGFGLSYVEAGLRSRRASRGKLTRAEKFRNVWGAGAGGFNGGGGSGGGGGCGGGGGGD